MPKPTINDDILRHLSYPERLRHLRALLREAVANTQMFDRMWNAKNDQINEWLDSSGKTDILQRTTIKKENITLQDLFAAGEWWRGKAVYLATLIQTEIMLEGEA